MASRFNIAVCGSGSNLNFRLKGDFDSDSADQLIEMLSKYSRQGVTMAVIETGALGYVHPSGKYLFQRRIHVLKDFCYRLIFSGENANQLAPDWIQYF